uniref:Proteophosphoglycan ppg4 n=1 Tax=Rhodopseudomonas palustris (strain BisA53) TaxID=316055 RepID=Q07V96_RHOP5
MKTSLIAIALSVALTGAAVAQPSQQGKAGANTSPTIDSANSSNQDSMRRPGDSTTQGTATGNSLSPGSGMTGSPHPSAQSNVGGSSSPSGTR